MEKTFFIIYIAFVSLLLISGACKGTAGDTRGQLTSTPEFVKDSMVTVYDDYSIVEIKKELDITIERHPFGCPGKLNVVVGERNDVTYYIINIDGYAVIQNSVHYGYNHIDLSVFEYDRYYIKFSNEFGQESIYLIIKE